MIACQRFVPRHETRASFVPKNAVKFEKLILKNRPHGAVR
jgi:hypothetical protein